MINHTAWQLALRAKAQTLQVATTGLLSLAASAAGYVRTVGSFLTDGFVVGMEVAPAGFASNTPRTVISVTANTLGVSGTLTVDPATAGRSLTCGLPTLQAWENVPLTPVVGRPYIVEQYLPGPVGRITLGQFGELESRPMYNLQIWAVPGVGFRAAAVYADALITLFAPSTGILASNGDTVLVRGDVGPYRGQLLQDASGWAVCPVTIPCRVRSSNSI